MSHAFRGGSADRATRCDNVAGEHDLVAGKINHQISAGMCRRPVEQLDFDAVDLQVLFILRYELIGEVIGWRWVHITQPSFPNALYHATEQVNFAVVAGDGGYRRAALTAQS